jgi:hypothetical protein
MLESNSYYLDFSISDCEFFIPKDNCIFNPEVDLDGESRNFVIPGEKLRFYLIVPSPFSYSIKDPVDVSSLMAIVAFSPQDQKSPLTESEYVSPSSTSIIISPEIEKVEDNCIKKIFFSPEKKRYCIYLETIVPMWLSPKQESFLLRVHISGVSTSRAYVNTSSVKSDITPSLQSGYISLEPQKTSFSLSNNSEISSLWSLPSSSSIGLILPFIQSSITKNADEIKPLSHDYSHPVQCFSFLSLFICPPLQQGDEDGDFKVSSDNMKKKKSKSRPMEDSRKSSSSSTYSLNILCKNSHPHCSVVIHSLEVIAPPEYGIVGVHDLALHELIHSQSSTPPSKTSSNVSDDRALTGVSTFLMPSAEEGYIVNLSIAYATNLWKLAVTQQQQKREAQAQTQTQKQQSDDTEELFTRKSSISALIPSNALTPSGKPAPSVFMSSPSTYSSRPCL